MHTLSEVAVYSKNSEAFLSVYSCVETDRADQPARVTSARAFSPFSREPPSHRHPRRENPGTSDSISRIGTPFSLRLFGLQQVFRARSH